MASRRPDAAGAETGARKERVLHTRVPGVLAEELKRLAEALRVPVSNVVRTVLEDAVETVSAMGRQAEGELMDLAERLRAEAARTQATPPRPPEPSHGEPRSEPDPAAPLAGVIGFQPLVLATDTTCRLSGRLLHAGDRAYVGVRAGAGPLVVVAPECVPVNLARQESSDPAPE